MLHENFSGSYESDLITEEVITTNATLEPTEAQSEEIIIPEGCTCYYCSIERELWIVQIGCVTCPSCGSRYGDLH